MEISQIGLARLLAFCVIWGAVMCEIYCALFSLRVLFGAEPQGKIAKKMCRWKLPKSKKILFTERKKAKIFERIFINACDFFCVVALAVGIILLNYGYNRGVFRGFSVVGAIAGFLLCRITFGTLSIRITEVPILLLIYLFSALFEFFLFPFKKIYKIMQKFLKKITSLCSFILAKRRKKLYNIKEEVCHQEEEASSLSSWRITVFSKNASFGGGETGGKEQK